MSKPAVSVENLSKAYLIGLKEEAHDSLTSSIVSLFKSPLRNLKRLRRLNTSNSLAKSKQSCVEQADILWALRDICFEVEQGEVVGIIGRNGAGKSTLLKVLSRITDPTMGRAIIRGRVSSLLEVGTGFHPELTGRENVYMNGTILGMRKREIDQKFDEIVDFSGVEKFLDTPVKRYSSGMKVRLAFAVAAHLEPEILVIDEVLAVGDFEFQKKCLGKMQDVAHGGRTVLFVSHNMAAVESLCSRAILLEAGKLVMSGQTSDILESYQRSTSSSEEEATSLLLHGRRTSDSVPTMQHILLKNAEGHPISTFTMGSPMTIEVDFSKENAFVPTLGVDVKTVLGVSVFGVSSRVLDRRGDGAMMSRGIINCEIESLPLMPGEYTLDLYLGDQHRRLDRIRDAVTFSVIASDVFGTGKIPSASSGPVWCQAAFETTNLDEE